MNNVAQVAENKQKISDWMSYQEVRHVRRMIHQHSQRLFILPNIYSRGSEGGASGGSEGSEGGASGVSEGGASGVSEGGASGVSGEPFQQPVRVPHSFGCGWILCCGTLSAQS